MEARTEQEKFWEGEFGTEYSNRNKGNNWIAANTAFFSKVFSRTNNVDSVLELGSNIGLNLIAIRSLLPSAHLGAVEINESAAAQLKSSLPEVDLTIESILDYEPDQTYDLTLTKGVLIHLNPDKLEKAYDALYKSSNRYILVAEYYNPAPVEIDYRGHSGKLFKRDFAGDMLDTYKDLTLIDYGFAYRRDSNFPQDDLTWFLMEKSSKQS